MTRTSEFVSPGHPDKVADNIVSHLLDEFIKHDPKVRFAVECQVKDNFVTLGGEITSSWYCDQFDITRIVRDAVCVIGYTPEYAARWGSHNCIDPDRLDVTIHMSQQSADIAQGVDADGWGDQGIFWGMATGDATTDYMPRDHYLAKKLGMALYEAARLGRLPIGLDIKTQVTVEDDRVIRVIVAAPVTTFEYGLRKWVREWLIENKCPVDDDCLIVNGTGAYVKHASAGDCGTTGRKLAVDFYGGNCIIGGGCPWGKDPSKADVTLNVYARHLALKTKQKTSVVPTIYTALDCCIGRREVDVVYYDESMNEIATRLVNRPASEIIAEMGLNRPVFASKCRNGLFTHPENKGA